jgi:hypothetical protein
MEYGGHLRFQLFKTSKFVLTSTRIDQQMLFKIFKSEDDAKNWKFIIWNSTKLSQFKSELGKAQPKFFVVVL